MIGSFKNSRENYPRKCSWTQEKQTRLKFNPRLSANRPSNNWAQDNSENLQFLSSKSKLLQSCWIAWMVLLIWSLSLPPTFSTTVNGQLKSPPSNVLLVLLRRMGSMILSKKLTCLFWSLGAYKLTSHNSSWLIFMFATRKRPFLSTVISRISTFREGLNWQDHYVLGCVWNRAQTGFHHPILSATHPLS